MQVMDRTDTTHPALTRRVWGWYQGFVVERVGESERRHRLSTYTLPPEVPTKMTLFPAVTAVAQGPATTLCPHTH